MTRMYILCFSLYIMSIFGIGLTAQQQIISYNADSESAGSAGNGPHLLLEESGDSGNGTQGGGLSDDGWARLWFKNASSPNDRWSFLARPHAGAQDNDGVIMQPLVMAHNGVQKFGFGMDGTLRINKSYVLPNVDGNAGDVMTTNGSGNVTWMAPSGGSGGSSQLLQDGDMDSEIGFLEGSGASTDAIVMSVGVGATSEEVMKVSNTLIDAKSKMKITSSSTSSSPQIQLMEEGATSAGRLFFTNQSTNDTWNIVGNSGSNAATVSFGANFNGALRFRYFEMDNTFEVLGTTLSDFVKLQPKTSAPACAAGGANNGTVFYYQSGSTKKLRVCIDGTWEDLH